MSSRPAAASSRPSSSGPGKRRTELGRYEYASGSPAMRPSIGTIRSNQILKNHDRGGRCGVVISSTTTRPPGRATRTISASPEGRSEKLRAPKPTVTASKASSPYGSSSALPHSKRTASDLRRASSSIWSEKSDPITSPPGPTRRSSAMARSPVPVATSSARSPGPTPDRSTARSRQRWCIPAVITEFIRSYTRATRSNIARTWGSESLPLVSAGAGAVMTELLELREEVDELVELLRIALLQSDERRHRRRGVHERAGDRVARQACPDVGEVRTGAGVAVLADLVAALAARFGRHEFAWDVLRRRL